MVEIFILLRNILILIYFAIIFYSVYRHYSLEYKYGRIQNIRKKQVIAISIFIILTSSYVFYNI